MVKLTFTENMGRFSWVSWQNRSCLQKKKNIKSVLHMRKRLACPILFLSIFEKYLKPNWKFHDSLKTAANILLEQWLPKWGSGPHRGTAGGSNTSWKYSLKWTLFIIFLVIMYNSYVCVNWKYIFVVGDLWDVYICIQMLQHAWLWKGLGLE